MSPGASAARCRPRRNWMAQWSRVELRYHPAFALALIDRAVMQAEGPVLPELDPPGNDPKARPVRRPRRGADGMFGGELGDPRFQRITAFQRPRLIGSPGADLAAARTGGEIGI